MKRGDKMYRYHDYATHDWVRVSLEAYQVTKVTPKGCWITREGMCSEWSKRFILNDARKKFAHPTKLDALQSFIARKLRQKKILECQLKRVEKVLDKSQDIKTYDEKSQRQEEETTEGISCKN